MTYSAAFDNLFKSAAAKYLAPWQGQPWMWLKAESIAESNLDPTVIAKDGGQGLMQFMPATWAEVCSDLDWTVTSNVSGEYVDTYPSPLDPVYAIPAGAYYLRKLYNAWSSPRPWFDHLQLTQASYNAGFGSLLQAQQLANGATDFDSIIAKLPQITGNDNAGITARYVDRIHSIYTILTDG
jgi:membrane-bound lytic murein transglycosylase MltF